MESIPGVACMQDTEVEADLYAWTQQVDQKGCMRC